MKKLRVRQTILRQLVAIGAAIAWGFLYCAIAGSLPSIQKLESSVQDSLIRLHNPGVPPQEILLLRINPAEISGYDLHNLSQLNLFYATLVNCVIDSSAKVVVLNLPEPMKQYVDADVRLTQPFKDSIRRYSTQIVLVARPTTLPSGAAALNIYNHLLPESKNAIAPEQIVSYFRYAPNARRLNNPARRAELFGRFNYEDDPKPNATHRVKSVATLALEKFYRASNDRAALHNLFGLQARSPLMVNFWGAAGTFPSIQAQCAAEHCHTLFDAQGVEKLHHKLVIVDFPEEKAQESYGERTPYGEMSIAEVQANLIASLMTHSFLKTTPKECDVSITMLGFVLMGLYLARRFDRPKVQFIHLSDLWVFLTLIGSYLGLSLLLFWQGWIFPLSIPISGWLGTGIGVATVLMLRQSIQQRQKLAERQAVLLQTRKLLHRVATDIHDGPLQELKLVMDQIELLNIHYPSPQIDPLLDHLEAIGLALRNQLSNTRTIAEKLEITPELQFGLALGIRQWLHQLLHTGDLTLQVDQHLQPLREPKSDSAWIDAREDIFRFFREAIANVIHHAQPPNGTATQVSIVLAQEGTQCRLVIENNGKPTVEEKKRKRGGYGTKLMTTIASELPDGAWERVALETGGMRVTLRWSLASLPD